MTDSTPATAATVEVDAERMARLRRALGRIEAIASEWQEASRVRRDDRAVIDAFDELASYAHGAAGEAFLMTYRDSEPSEFERLLATPGEQFDKNSEVLATVLAHQRGTCSHANRATYPPGTMGGSPVTACNDCGLYL